MQMLNFTFTNNTNAQLYQYTQLEVVPNFYSVRSMASVRKISVNLLALRLLAEH